MCQDSQTFHYYFSICNGGSDRTRWRVSRSNWKRCSSVVRMTTGNCNVIELHRQHRRSFCSEKGSCVVAVAGSVRLGGRGALVHSCAEVERGSSCQLLAKITLWPADWRSAVGPARCIRLLTVYWYPCKMCLATRKTPASCSVVSSTKSSCLASRSHRDRIA